MKLIAFNKDDRCPKAGGIVAVVTDDDEILTLGSFDNRKSFKQAEEMLLFLLERLGHIGEKKREIEEHERIMLQDFWKDTGGFHGVIREYT